MAVPGSYYLRPFGADFYVRVAAGGTTVCADGREYQRTLFAFLTENGGVYYSRFTPSNPVTVKGLKGRKVASPSCAPSC